MEERGGEEWTTGRLVLSDEGAFVVLDEGEMVTVPSRQTETTSLCCVTASKSSQQRALVRMFGDKHKLPTLSAVYIRLLSMQASPLTDKHATSVFTGLVVTVHVPV